MYRYSCPSCQVLNFRHKLKTTKSSNSYNWRPGCVTQLNSPWWWGRSSGRRWRSRRVLFQRFFPRTDNGTSWQLTWAARSLRPTVRHHPPPSTGLWLWSNPALTAPQVDEYEPRIQQLGSDNDVPLMPSSFQCGALHTLLFIVSLTLYTTLDPTGGLRYDEAWSVLRNQFSPLSCSSKNGAVHSYVTHHFVCCQSRHCLLQLIYVALSLLHRHIIHALVVNFPTNV